MKFNTCLRSVATFVVATCAIPCAIANGAKAQQAPNLLIIVADDLGYSDLGAFGGEIDTPNLDAIARSGIRFTGFHAAPTCSPSRAMLLTGVDNHQAGLGNMAEMMAPNQKGIPGYEGYLRSDAITLAERLAVSGYRTLMSGKWHLGIEPEQDPSARGFQHSFAMLQAAHNHFGADISTDPAKGSTYRRDGVTLSTLPADFYSSDAFTSELIEQLLSSRRSAEGSKPFFAYLAFTAPHFPLQAPSQTIGKYKGRYDKGYDVVRARRLDRQRALGLLSPRALAHPMTRAKRWNQLKADEQQVQIRKMEIYAAMVDRLDQNVGRVIRTLKQTGEYKNTIIFFMADNGAEAVEAEYAPNSIMRNRWGASDHRLEAMGAAASFVTYGPAWAQVGTAPSWLYKSSTAEGGTRVPAFLAGKGIGKVGAVQPAFLSELDIVPTFLDFAQAAAASLTFKGQSVQPVMGKSWLPMLRGNARQVYGPNQAVGTQIFSGRSLREGAWKITDIGDGHWLLFNIAADPGETRDLAALEPQPYERLLKAYREYAGKVGVVMPVPAITPR